MEASITPNASESVKIYGKDVVRTSGMLTGRHIRYATFVKWLHDSFLKSIIKKSEKTEQIRKMKEPFEAATGKKKATREYKKATLPRYEDDKSGSKVGPMMPISGFSEFVAKHDSAQQVQKFLQRLEFKGCEEGEEGTSWLELYVLYKKSGGKCVVNDPKEKAQANLP